MRSVRAASAVLAAAVVGILGSAPIVAQAASSPQPIPTHQKGGKTINVPANTVTFALGTSDGAIGDGRSSYNWTIAPGAHRFDYAIAYNISKQPLTLRILPVDGITDTTGYLLAAQTKAKQHVVGTWIQTYTRTVTIPALKSIVIPFKVTVPKNAAVGDHGGAFVAATIPHVITSQGKTFIQRETRLAMPVYVRVAGALTTKIAFTSFKASFKTQAFRPGFGDVTVRYSVVNTGNVRIGATQHISLKGFIGSPSRVANPAPIAQILPDNVYQGTVVFKHVPAALSLKVTGVVIPRPLDPNSPAGSLVTMSTTVVAISWSAVALATTGITIVVLLVLIGLQVASGSGKGLLKTKKGTSAPEAELAAVGAAKSNGERQE